MMLICLLSPFITEVARVAARVKAWAALRSSFSFSSYAATTTTESSRLFRRDYSTSQPANADQ